MIKLLAIMLATATLTGCSLTPDYQRPAAPVAPAYPDYGVAQVDGTAAAIGWREFYRDPLLQTLITQALTNNRDLRIAALNVEAARASYRIQRADTLPTLAAQGSGLVQRTPGSLSAGGQSAVGRSYQVGERCRGSWICSGGFAASTSRRWNCIWHRMKPGPPRNWR